MVQIRGIKLISVADLHPNAWNPNVCSEGMLEALKHEIQEDGFDQPLQVVPCQCNQLHGAHYQIIGGEHRWRAAQSLAMPELPCVVFSDWQEATQKIKTVRRNMLHGDLDSAKFTKLVHDLEEDGYNKETLASLMAFPSEAVMAKHIMEEERRIDTKVADEYQAAANRDMVARDSLSDVVHMLFRESGDTVDQGFLAFAYKGKTHVLVLMTPELDSVMMTLVQKLKDGSGNMNDVLLQALKGGVP